MKLPIPTFRNTIALVGAVKDLLPNNNTSDSSLLRVIEEQADAIYSKKQEIAVLEKKVEDLEGIYKSLKRRTWDLEESLTITSDELREAEIRASEAGG